MKVLCLSDSKKDNMKDAQKGRKRNSNRKLHDMGVVIWILIQMYKVCVCVCVCTIHISKELLYQKICSFPKRFNRLYISFNNIPIYTVINNAIGVETRKSELERWWSEKNLCS